MGHQRDDARLRLPPICQSVLKIQSVPNYHQFRLEARAQSRTCPQTTSSQRTFLQPTLLHLMSSMVRLPSSSGPGGLSSNLRPFLNTTCPPLRKTGSVDTDPVHRWASGDNILHTAVLRSRGIHRWHETAPALLPAMQHPRALYRTSREIFTQRVLEVLVQELRMRTMGSQRPIRSLATL